MDLINKDFRKSRILITGGTGFLGSALDHFLAYHWEMDWDRVFTPISCSNDLTDPVQVARVFRDVQPHYVFHLAGYNGGIQFNAKYPWEIFSQNTLMAINVFNEAIRCQHTKKIVSVVTSCAYDKYHLESPPTQNFHFMTGECHESVACHGYAKRNLQLCSRFAESKIPSITVCPPTIYGPGDRIDESRSKFVGGLVSRFVRAKHDNQSTVTCWGTGSPLREVLYVDDAAGMLAMAMVSNAYTNTHLPLNIGTGEVVSIKQITEMISELVGYEGRIHWDETKPDGQYQKSLDSSAFRNVVMQNRQIPTTPLREGLLKTIKDYQERLCLG